MKEALTKLIKVKTIVTLLLTLGWLYLAFTSVIDGEAYKMLYTIVIGFYFGTQVAKKE